VAGSRTAERSAEASNGETVSGLFQTTAIDLLFLIETLTLLVFLSDNSDELKLKKKRM
jgi:hypothetical protein